MSSYTRSYITLHHWSGCERFRNASFVGLKVAKQLTNRVSFLTGAGDCCAVCVFHWTKRVSLDLAEDELTNDYTKFTSQNGPSGEQRKIPFSLCLVVSFFRFDCDRETLFMNRSYWHESSETRWYVLSSLQWCSMWLSMFPFHSSFSMQTHFAEFFCVCIRMCVSESSAWFECDLCECLAEHDIDISVAIIAAKLLMRK